MIPVILGVLLIVFALSAVAPGDPVDNIVGVEAPPEVRQQVREELHLDDPFIVRYGRYVFDLVTKGDLGKSWTTKQPVMKELMQKFPNTLRLAFTSIAISMLIAIPLGVISAVKQYSAIDNVSMVAALIGVSVPQFWFALMMLVVFAVKLRWLPATTSMSGVAGWIMPVVMLGIAGAGNTARTTRSSMLEVVRQDYMRTARSKGQKEFKVIMKHGLRNGLIPVVANIGNGIGVSLGGAVIAESIFSIDGVGKYMLNAINQRNWPSVTGGLVIMAISFSIVMLVMDILYTVIDPRLKDAFNAKNKMAAQKRAMKKAEKAKKAAAAKTA